MLSLGNDIVDFHEDKIPLHPRYLERVFSANELVRIGDSERLIWLYWAAKEASFKALKRRNLTLGFIPIEIQFDHTTKQITVEGKTMLDCQWTETDDYVYVTCINNNSTDKPLNIKNIIECGDSSSVKQSTSRKIAEDLSVDPETVEIKISPNSTPIIYVQGKEYSDLVSITDHGRFAACLYALNLDFGSIN